jgi:hypothetical protein
MKNKPVSLLFYAAVVFSVAVYFRSIDVSKLEGVRFSLPLLLVSTAVAVLFRFWGCAVWLLLLRSMGVENFPDLMMLVYAYAKSWLGRYIPGTVVWIFGKVYFASKLGVSRNKLAVSSVVEGGAQVAVLMVLSCLSLLMAGEFALVVPALRVAMICIVTVILLTLYPPVFNRLLGLAVSITRKPVDASQVQVGFPTLMRAFLLYGVGFFLSGLSYFFFATSITDTLGWENFWFLLGAFNLAGAVGIAAVFVPSGLFVREGLQVLLLSAVVPVEMALVISISSRVWSLLVDLLFFITAYVLKGLHLSPDIQ